MHRLVKLFFNTKDLLTTYSTKIFYTKLQKKNFTLKKKQKINKSLKHTFICTFICSKKIKLTQLKVIKINKQTRFKFL